jgi:hypothetical protein
VAPSVTQRPVDSHYGGSASERPRPAMEHVAYRRLCRHQPVGARRQLDVADRRAVGVRSNGTWGRAGGAPRGCAVTREEASGTRRSSS